MHDSYQRAAGQSGTGMDVRQKAIIREQVTMNGSKMFKEASSFINGELDRLLQSVDGGLEERCHAMSHTSSTPFPICIYKVYIYILY